MWTGGDGFIRIFVEMGGRFTAREGDLAEGDHSWDGAVHVRVSLDMDVARYNYPGRRLQRDYPSPVLLMMMKRMNSGSKFMTSVPPMQHRITHSPIA